MRHIFAIAVFPLLAAIFVISPLFITELTVMIFFVKPVHAGALFLALTALSIRFNRSRYFFAGLLLAMTGTFHFLSLSLKSEFLPFYQFTFICILSIFPINLLLISVYRERGFLTPIGFARMVLLVSQPAVFSGLYFFFQEESLAFLKQCGVIKDSLLFMPQYWYWGVYLLTMVLVFLVFILRQTTVDGGLFFVTMICGAAVFHARHNELFLWFLSGALFMLLVSLIDASYRLAFRDELTGLPGRRALKEAMMKLGSTYTLAMVDIDFFKKFNDRFGHDVGDQVLKMVASHLSKVRGGGKAFRYGGEEFTIIFSGKAAKDTLTYLENLRISIEKAGFYVRSKSRPKNKKTKRPEKRKKKAPRKTTVTVSIGAAERNGLLSKPTEVMKAADKALYKAKKNGRNQVCL